MIRWDIFMISVFLCWGLFCGLTHGMSRRMSYVFEKNVYSPFLLLGRVLKLWLLDLVGLWCCSNCLDFSVYILCITESTVLTSPTITVELLFLWILSIFVFILLYYLLRGVLKLPTVFVYLSNYHSVISFQL